MPDVQQSAHFFDRVPASDAAAAAVRRAWVKLDAATGQYVLTDSEPVEPGDVQAYLVTAADGAVVLSSSGPSDRTLALYGDNTVQLL